MQDMPEQDDWALLSSMPPNDLSDDLEFSGGLTEQGLYSELLDHEELLSDRGKLMEFQMKTVVANSP